MFEASTWVLGFQVAGWWTLFASLVAHGRAGQFHPGFEARRVHDRGGGCGPGRLQGFGFVQFESRDAAERAVALNGQALMGRQLVVNPANMAFSEKQAGQPQANCWFCLSNPNADVSLVASIGAARSPFLPTCVAL